MSDGKELGQPRTVIGLSSLFVVQIASLLEAREILQAVMDGLRIVAPTLATQPIAVMVFIAFLCVLGFCTYWLGLHYKHKASGRYAAPKPRNSASSIQRRASKDRRHK